MKYTCGHEVKPVFTKNNIVHFHLYKMWKDSKSKLCFNCWNESNKKEFLELSAKVLNSHKDKRDNEGGKE